MDIFIIFILLLLGLGQLVLAFYLLDIKAKLKVILVNPDPKSLNILHRTYGRARDIIANAELAGIKIHAQSKLETKKLNEELALEVEGAASKIEQVLYKSAEKANTSYEKALAQHTQNIEKEMATVFQTDVAQMKKALEDYKTARMAAMDENFNEVAKRAVELVLAKKLTASDQTELVLEALEQAKKEKLI